VPSYLQSNILFCECLSLDILVWPFFVWNNQHRRLQLLPLCFCFFGVSIPCLCFLTSECCFECLTSPLNLNDFDYYHYLVGISIIWFRFEFGVYIVYLCMFVFFWWCFCMLRSFVLLLNYDHCLVGISVIWFHVGFGVSIVYLCMVLFFWWR